MKKDINQLASHNPKAHNIYYQKYEQIHKSIFNPIEQKRIHKKLKYALKNIKSDSNPIIAFDYGCGTGNLTKHLIKIGIHTVSADVSEKFLQMVEKKNSNSGLVKVLKVNGQDLSNINDDSWSRFIKYK
jgi:2-polyprenyl-3-methyl-5-hydroxy-6-metoxy-1,4-benzoquinol methylase